MSSRALPPPGPGPSPDHGPGSDAASPWAVRALYAGGLLGPLGGGLTAVMLTELSDSFGVSTATAGLALTTYFVPFAAVQLVSGTLGERWGRRRSVRTAYLVYVVASLGAAAAPGIGVFLSARAVQGAANAFTSPLLVAGLADTVRPARLSRSIGIFAAAQASGQSFAPLVGSAANAVSWRWAFVAVAVVSAVLALRPPDGEPRPREHAPPWRPLFGGRMALLYVAAFASYLGVAGLPFLVGLYAERRLGVSTALIGVVLVGFGVAGLVLSAVWGTVCERLGATRAGALGLALAAVAVAGVAHTDSVAALVVVWVLAGVAVSLATVAIQILASNAVPANRGGSLSVTAAFRFAGGALAPVVLLPLYPLLSPALHRSQAAMAFGVAAVVGLVGAAALVLRGRQPDR